MLALIAAYRWQEKRDKQKSPAIIAGVPDENRNEHLLNTSADYYS
jgi:hypothetical protein